MWTLPSAVESIFKGGKWWRGKADGESLPCIRNLGSFSLSESGWAFCFEMEFLFSFFGVVGWLHTQPVKAMAVNNRIHFWDRGSKQSVESHPRVIYSPKVCLFYFSTSWNFENWGYAFLLYFHVLLRWMVLLESRKDFSREAFLRCEESRENSCPKWILNHMFQTKTEVPRTLYDLSMPLILDNKSLYGGEPDTFVRQ